MEHAVSLLGSSVASSDWSLYDLMMPHMIYTCCRESSPSTAWICLQHASAKYLTASCITRQVEFGLTIELAWFALRRLYQRDLTNSTPSAAQADDMHTATPRTSDQPPTSASPTLIRPS